MYVGRDFSPADVGESAEYTFDFVRDLAVGETITGATWVCWAESGSDPDAAARLIGAPSFSGTRTTQRVAGLLAGVKYGLQAIVTTSANNVVSLFSYVRGQNPVD
jgi:hypothetical protein